MVELTRVCEVTIPLWDARDRHCGARLAIAHLLPTIPQQTWFRGVVHCTCHPRCLWGYPRPYTFRVMRDTPSALRPRTPHAPIEYQHLAPGPDSHSFSCPTRMLCGFPAQEQPRSEQRMATHYTVVMADAPHTNIPDGTHGLWGQSGYADNHRGACFHPKSQMACNTFEFFRGMM